MVDAFSWRQVLGTVVPPYGAYLSYQGATQYYQDSIKPAISSAVNTAAQQQLQPATFAQGFGQGLGAGLGGALPYLVGGVLLYKMAGKAL